MHKLKIAILVGQAVLGMLDARATRQNILHGGIERNPMVRPLVHSPVIYAEFPAESAAQFLIGKKLEAHHPKLAKVFFALQVNDLANHAEGYTFSKLHSR